MSKRSQNDDYIALIVCTPEDAIYLTTKDPDLASSLVITETLDVGTLYVVPKDDFLDWLQEKGEYEVKNGRDGD